MSQTPPPPPEGYGPPPGSYDPPPAGGYGAPPSPPGSGSRPGELLDRFLARLIDLVIVGIVGTVVLGAIVGAVIGSDGDGGAAYAATAVAAILGAAISLGYFSLLESNRGQTVGMIALKLKVVGPGGANPTLEQAAKRNLWTGLGILGIIPVLGTILQVLLVLGAIVLIIIGIQDGPERRTYFDKLADCQVLKIG